MPRTGPDPASTNTHRIETARLVIEMPEPSDAPTLFSLVGGSDRAEVCATLVWDGPDDVAEVKTWIERCRTERFEPFGFHWVIRDRHGAVAGEPGSVLGAIGTRPTETPGRGDVGYWLGRPYWGMGIMAEALRAVLELGFETLGYAKIDADVFTTNERGRRLVERAGMTLEGTIRRALRKQGEWVDVAVYGMIPEEMQS